MRVFPLLAASMALPACSSLTPAWRQAASTFVERPAGTFEVGCTPGAKSSGWVDDDECTVMPVELTYRYEIGAYEVTQGEAAYLLGLEPASDEACGPACPAEGLSWHMAAALANARSDEEGLEQCYVCTGADATLSCTPAGAPAACAGYRLATEAEWEGAARCGRDLLYAGSDDAAEVAWYEDNSDDQLQEVGGKAPNDCGLYDMSGNAKEWVHDWYGAEYYTDAGRVDPHGPEAGQQRGIRGGSYTSSAPDQRVANRGSVEPDYVADWLGMRLARTLSPQ